jgi:predicted metal-binding transcription factor (methanogenesis marker protein 9)
LCQETCFGNLVWNHFQCCLADPKVLHDALLQICMGMPEGLNA